MFVFVLRDKFFLQKFKRKWKSITWFFFWLKELCFSPSLPNSIHLSASLFSLLLLSRSEECLHVYSAVIKSHAQNTEDIIQTYI